MVRRPERQRSRSCLPGARIERHSHHAVAAHVQQIPPSVHPSDPRAIHRTGAESALGQLPRSVAGRIERSDAQLPATRFIGCVREPAAVGRDRRTLLIDRTREQLVGYAAGREREQEDTLVEAVLHRKQRAPVGRDRAGILVEPRGRDEHRAVAGIRPAGIDVEHAVLLLVVESPSIRAPDRTPVHAGAAGDPRPDAGCEVGHPDVRCRRGKREGDPPLIGRQADVGVGARLGERGAFMTRTVQPDQPLGRGVLRVGGPGQRPVAGDGEHRRGREPADGHGCRA